MRPNDSNEIIELNVGGCAYTTSRMTLLSYPDSMLSRMISGQIPNATDNKQRIFIDRDGPLFRHILNFLRDKRLNLPENFSEYAQLRQEADFYRIEPILNHLDCIYHSKLNLSSKNSLSSSLSSLVSPPDNSSQGSKGLYFTIISKLHQGTLETLIGCVRILSILSSLDANSKRFMSCLTNQNSAQGANNQLSVNIVDSFVCECKFMHEEKIICCKPCGINGNGNDPKLANLCQSIVKMAKRFGITTGYWEDMFYLSLESSVPNREQLCSLLTEKTNAKLLSSCVCDRRSSYDDNTNCQLIERWFLSDLNATKS